MKRLGIVFLVALVMAFSTSASATLIDNGNGFIFDDDLNITWYDFSYGPNNFTMAQLWADDLELDVNDILYDDWRLPTYVLDTNGEMGHLFYDELSNTGEFGLLNSGPFSSLHADSWSDYYWTGTAGIHTGQVWAFTFYGGAYNSNAADWNYYALAVHQGNVGAPVATPKPASMLLLGSGLAGLAALRRRCKRA